MNTRFGVHHPSDYYWRPPDPHAYAEELIEHGVSWYTLWANDLALVELCDVLSQHGIEIIYRPGIMRIPDPLILEHIRPYHDRGAKYIQIYNEPNLENEWRVWQPHTAPEHFARVLLNRIGLAKEIGFTAVITPLSPGGHIWHRQFFRRMLKEWDRLGVLQEVWDQAVCGIHNRPITNHPDSDADCSFNEYKWYRQTLKEYLGRTVPMVAPEAYYEPQWCRFPDGRYDWFKWMSWNLALIRRFRPATFDYVGDDFLASCFWLIQDNNRTWEHCGLRSNWYYANDHHGVFETNLWKALASEDWSKYEVKPEPPPPPSYSWLKGLVKLDVSFLDLRGEVWKLCNQPACLNTRRTLDGVRGITIHHTGVSRQRVQPPYEVAKWYIEKYKVKGPPYHVLISSGGVAYLLGYLKDTLPCTGRFVANQETISIGLVGNFTMEEPTPAQIETLEKVNSSLVELLGGGWGKHRGLWFTPHKYIVTTECPGDWLEQVWFWK